MNKKPKQKDDKNKQTAVIDDIKHNYAKEESDYSMVSKLLCDDRYKRRKTVLNNVQQAGLITALDVISQLYDIPFLKHYINNYAEWLTSIGAKGRNDIVDISKFRFTENEKHLNQVLELMGRK